MNNRLIYFLLTILVLTSCNKSYKYVEKIEREGILGGIETEEKEVEIKADSDSTAYLEAFKKFKISEKVNEQMKSANIPYTPTSLSFNIYDEKGNNITYISFPSRTKREGEIIRIISGLKTTSTNNENNTHSKIDSTKIKNLEKHFIKKKDEFSPDGIIWYKPKSAPIYSNQNGIYCYFQTAKNVPSNLRFSIQYYSDEWLFIKKIQFSIDERAYEYVPLNIESDSGNGGYIWEWFDDSVSNSNQALIKAIAKAKNVKIKFIGRQYYATKTMTKSQIDGIRNTVDLYNAMGGKF